MSALIHHTAIIEDGAKLADTVKVGPYCHIGESVVLEANVVLETHVCLKGRTRIGEGTHIHPFTVLGGPPQHLGYKGQPTGLFIGANNTIHEHVTMHIGTIEGNGETRVGENNLFMAGSHVAHDCIVGNNTVFANSSIIGGHVLIEDFVFLGGGVAVHQHCQIGMHAFLGGGAIVIHDVLPFVSVNGNYAKIEGLNVVGLKRRGFSREEIATVRSVYKSLFSDETSFQERLTETREKFRDHKYALQMIDFIQRERVRPIMMTG